MPSTTERLGKLEQAVSALVERVDNLKEMARLDSGIREEGARLRDVDKRVALIAEDVARLQKKQDELVSRRWEFIKIILAAIFGASITVASGFANRSLGHFAGGISAPSATLVVPFARK